MRFLWIDRNRIPRALEKGARGGAVAALFLSAAAVFPASADVQITDGTRKHYSVAWSHDELSIYSESLGASEFANQLTSTPASGGASTLLSSGSANHAGIDVSPVGGELLYTTDLGSGPPQVAWMPAGGGVETVVTGGALHSGPVFSTDGTRIAYMAFMPPDSSIAVTTQPFPMGPASTWATGSSYLDPQWSPDGSRIACVKPGPSGYLQIVLLSGPGLESSLTTSSVHHLQPRWSPDGTKLVCLRWVEGAETEVWLVDVASGVETVLVADGLNHGFPSWSPDGAWILYQTESAGGTVEIGVTSADGSVTLVVTSGPTHRMLPEWAPSGGAIAYLGYAVDDPQIWTVPFTGPPTAVLVQVRQFDAAVVDGGIELRWSAPEGATSGWVSIYRSLAEATEEIRLATVPSGVEGGIYRDADARAGASYRYRLGLLATDGSEIRGPSLTVALPAGGLALHGVAPNPIREGGTISFHLPQAMEVALGVYRIDGGLARRLVAARLPAGPHRIAWDGRDGAGGRLPAGSYYVRLHAAWEEQAVRIVQIR